MTSYGLDEWFCAMFEPSPTWPNFTYSQLFILRPVVLTLIFPWPFWRSQKTFCTLYHEWGSICGHHNSLNRLTDFQSWFQQLAGMMKLCTKPIVLTLTFYWPLCKVTKIYIFWHIVPWMVHFVDTITHWTIWHWSLIMVSTVSNYDVVVHKTYCFDLDLSLIHKS